MRAWLPRLSRSCTDATAVSATDGAVAWETAKWKINIATVPTPVILDDGRVFFTGGYNAGSMLVRFTPDGPSGKLSGEEVFRVKASVFGALSASGWETLMWIWGKHSGFANSNVGET